MKDYFLATTALEETWPDDDQSVLFLGEWCRLYSRKHHWIKMDAKVVPYHWDDRVKLYRDYDYLCNLYENLLTKISSELNKIHGVNHTLRYWRILIGPWLINFIPIVFDRWSCLEKALSLYNIKGTKIFESEHLDNIPKNMHHFTILQEDDGWNDYLFFSILKSLDFDKIIIKKGVNKIKIDKAKKGWSKSSVLKTGLNVLSFFASKNDYFMISPYLRWKDNIKLQLKLFQLPASYYSGNYGDIDVIPSKAFRKWQIESSKNDTIFEKIVKELIPLQIPLAYLEGYNELHNKTKQLKWPKKPKLIWTSNSYYLDDVFKLWAAERVEEKIPLVIGQHGGHYGQGLFSFTENHELKICDHYLSWGWESADNKVIPVGMFKKNKLRKRKRKSKNRSLFVISGAPRYSGTLLSIPLAGQVNRYMVDQLKFYEYLSSHVSENIIIRLYPHDYGMSQFNRWKDAFPNSNIDNGKLSFGKLLGSVDLLIAGWNSTTYLESLSSNIPTVIFWNPEYFELREDAVILFEGLKKVGIYHDNAVAAANHVTKIWDDIDGWWNKSDVIAAKEKFLDKYANSCSLLDKLKFTLNSLGKSIS